MMKKQQMMQVTPAMGKAMAGLMQAPMRAAAAVTKPARDLKKTGKRPAFKKLPTLKGKKRK